MIVVGDLIPELNMVLGRCDNQYVFSILSRAVETLARKASATSITWDPLLVYLDLPVQSDFYVFLPQWVEKPVRINLNSNPTFSHSSLYEFVQNGPGSQDLEAGYQWQDRLTSPIQTKFPEGNNLTLTAVSDSASDVGISLHMKVRLVDFNDVYIDLPIAPHGTIPVPSAQAVIGVLEVVKPATVGTVTLSAGALPVAIYYPDVTFPEFSVIKLSQRALSVRMLARRKTSKITSLLDVIPLNSAQAVLMMAQAIKYYDEVHFELAAAAEAQAVTFLNEEQAARNNYTEAAAMSEVTTALNLTIGQRDVVIVSDIYDDACRIFGFIGRQKIFDRITQTMELLYNKCQYWDGLVGVVTLRADQDYYVALPRYVDTILALNVNRTIGSFKNQWFEFSYAGSGEFGDLYQNAERWIPWAQLAATQGSTRAAPFGVGISGYVSVNGTNRVSNGWEEQGTTPLAFRLRGPSKLYAQPVLPQDNGAKVVVYGYDDQENPVINAQGQWGVEVPCQFGEFVPAPYVFNRVERVTKDPTLSFVNLFGFNALFNPATPLPPNFQSPSCPLPGCPPEIPPDCITPPGLQNPTGQTDWLAMYWPWDIEPQYRLIRVGTMCKRVRIRYKKNWTKIESLTDPLHVRSRQAIILAMTGLATMNTGGGGSNASPFQPTAPVQIATDQLDLAVTLLDDEWRSRNPHATIQLQWSRNTYGNAFPQTL
jgi:hypothetical protein